jgi:hypothetical protein
MPDECDLSDGTSEDCNTNTVPDECDLADGYSLDWNDNGVPDECDEDCNENGLPDFVDIQFGLSDDCNSNTRPDECDVIQPGDFDADGDGDLDHFRELADSMAGPGQVLGYPAPECLTRYLDAFDFDLDSDMDLYDLSVFAQQFTGSQ